MGFAAMTTVLLCLAVISAEAGRCNKPMKAVLATLECVQTEDAVCAGAGYNPDFKRYHNGVDTNTVITGPAYWAGAFAVVDLVLDYNHKSVVCENQISLRYVESVHTLFNTTIIQHEHALVTVDDDCRILKWDQYGDDAEQQAVDDYIALLVGGAA